MQRDIGNEVIVAIAAIGVLAFAVAFAIILSLSGRTSTPPTMTPSLTVTTEVLFIPEASATSPTAIMPLTETPTPLPASPTLTQLPTKALSTDTPQRPSATPVLASRTPKPTTATRTPTNVPTHTPTLTRTPIPTITPSATRTPSPTTSSTPTPTPSTTVTSIPATIPPVTLSSIQLQREGCTDPSTQITYPVPRQIVNGVLKLSGTAWLEDFAYYKIETRPDFATIYNIYSRSEATVIQGELGEIDTRIFGSGIYWLKLTVVNKDGLSPISCAIPVVIE
ncbi:MAG: hypothetical protein K8L97_03010 [Anaerolineae bacterium]|nr:hypothetical protein [Anaerolineae bacterium]